MLLLQADIVSCKGYAWLRSYKQRVAMSTIDCAWLGSLDHTEYMRSFKVGTLKKVVSRAGGGDSLADGGGETFIDRHTAVNMSVCDVTV